MISCPEAVWLQESTAEALERHFVEKVSDGSVRGRDGLTPQLFERYKVTELTWISEAIAKGQYNFSDYLLQLRLKGRKQPPREISVPTVRDRIVLRALAVALKRVLPFTSIELPQSMIRRVIDTLSAGEYRFFLKIDVKDFYPSINHDWLQNTLTKNVGSSSFSRMLMAAVSTPSRLAGETKDGYKNPTGVPQGLAVSNGLAELAMQHLDEAMQKERKLAYFRYVDDILIFSESELSDVFTNRVGELLEPVGLRLHQNEDGDEAKSARGLIREGFEFLGYRFHWPRVTVRLSSISKLESRIAGVFTRFKYAVEKDPANPRWREISLTRLKWHLNLVISGCVLEGKRFGWIAYFSQIRHQQLLKHLDHLVQKQMKRHNVGAFIPKTFVESYRIAASRKLDRSGFVSNFDETPVTDQRELLVQVFGLDRLYASRLSEEEIMDRFRRKVKRVAADLERDVSGSY